MFQIVRTEEEINEVIGACDDAEDLGSSKFPGMTYDQGVRAALDWVMGLSNDHPMKDE